MLASRKRSSRGSFPRRWALLAALAAVGVIIFPGLSSATPTGNPTVTTGAATSVTNVGATLNGTVNPNDPDTAATYDYTFSLGTDSNNLSNAGGGSIPGDTNADPVSLPLSGLSPNTTYYFQLCAVNDADSTDSGCGATQSFQTPDQPAVTLGSASAVTSTSATLNGSVDPNGASTSYLFYYGTSSHPDCNFYSDSIGGSAGNGRSSTPESKSISGLSPHTTYYFRLAASNSYGTVCSSSEGSFTTSDKPVVTLGSASSITSTTATLSGTVNPNGDATTYVFVYGTSSSADCTHYSSSSTGGSAGSGSSPTPESDSISGLSPKTTYFFRLSASNGNGTTCSSTQGSFTTPDKPTVTLGSASSVTNTSATLSGSVNPNGAATTYVFHYGTSSSGTCSGYPGSSTGGSAGSGTSSTPESDSISGLSPKTTYFFRLAATNTFGTTCSGTEGSFTTADAPTSVTGSAAAITTHGATLERDGQPERIERHVHRIQVLHRLHRCVERCDCRSLPEPRRGDDPRIRVDHPEWASVGYDIPLHAVRDQHLRNELRGRPDLHDECPAQRVSHGRQDERTDAPRRHVRRLWKHGPRR